MSNDVIVYGTEERRNRAIILDAKLEQALLDTYIHSAELVDEKLYKELTNPETEEPFKTAKEYFNYKAISVAQAYQYARIGRTISPHLTPGNTSSAKLLANVGPKKLNEIVRHAADEIPTLLNGEGIQLGDEVYTAEDLQRLNSVKLSEELKKISKKVQQNEVLDQKLKNSELEKKELMRLNEELEKRDAKYREISSGYDDIEKDIREASECFERTRILINRIDSSELPEALGIKLSTLINIIQESGLTIADKHQEVMFNHSSEI